MGKEERRVAGSRTEPLTFAPAGEPVPPRVNEDGAIAVVTATRRLRCSPAETPGRTQAHRRPRLRQVFGLVDVLLGLLSVASRMPGIQCV